MSFIVPSTLIAEDPLPDGVGDLAERGHVVHDPGDVREGIDRAAAAATICAIASSSVMSPATVTMSASGVLGGEFLEALCGDVDGDDAATFARDARRGGAADAGAGTGHDDRLAGEAALVEALDPFARLGSSGGSGRRRSGFRDCCRRTGRDIAGSCATNEFVERFLAERALAELDEPLDGEAADGLERIRRLSALSEHVGEERIAGRVFQPVCDRGVCGESGHSGPFVFRTTLSGY